MYVIDPLGKEQPYGINYGPFGTPFVDLPPWNGLVSAPAWPGDGGHFDHLEPGTPAFEAAHVFGCARFVLDVWERFFGQPLAWHFGRHLRRLEIVLLPQFDNAHAGYGFLEVGSHFTDEGEALPFSLNFDIIAHEVGHLIVSAQVGSPSPVTAEGEYFGFHESAADLVALIASAHFDSVIEALLRQTRGNLYVLNRLNRIGELSDNDEIRLASNPVKLSAFADGWTKEHQLSLPLTGAMFDILVDVFHEKLLEKNLITPEVEDLADQVERLPEYEGVIQAAFDEAYWQKHDGFKETLLEARDYLGYLLAQTWSMLSPHYLNYTDVAAALLRADRRLSGGSYQRLILTNMGKRDIGTAVVGPRLSPPGRASHAFSARTVQPEARRQLPRMSHREQWELARRRARPYR